MASSLPSITIVTPCLNAAATIRHTIESVAAQDYAGEIEHIVIDGGSTDGTIKEAREQLAEQGISTNQLQIRWLVPLHGDAILKILSGAKHTIIVENNYSGQFARYLRSETSFVANGHIRKYDGEPFMPHHIVEAVREQLAGSTTLSVPTHEVMV